VDKGREWVIAFLCPLDHGGHFVRYLGSDSGTVPFHSIRQSRVTEPPKMLKCHGCHGVFHGVPNSFSNHVTDI
jgi:hypothetical protein